MSNSLSLNEDNSTELNHQNPENQVCNELPKNETNNNQENETNNLPNIILEKKDNDLNNGDTNEEEDIENTQITDLNKNDEPSNININTSNEEEDFKNTDKINFVEEEELTDLVNNNNNEEEDSILSIIQLNEEEELTDLVNHDNNEEEDSILTLKQLNEEEESQNDIFAEEEDEFLIENDNPVVTIDSDIDYSFDSEDELINEIFDENRPTITVRRNYQDEFDKRSVRSLRSIRSSRSTRSIKKKHISKIQKYNVTRPFTKTDHFDTKPNPPEDEFKEEHDPIRYAGSRGFLNRQTKSNKHRVELRSQEPTDRGFDPPLYKKKEKIKNPNPPYNWWKPKQEAEGYVSSTPANSYLEDLFRQSVKKPPVIIEEPFPEMYKVNQTSNKIAKQKNQELIEVITGKEKTIPEVKFVSIMRRFNISNTPEPKEPFAPRPLICKIKDIVKIDDNLYDNAKLRELLISAMTGEDMDEISKELRPPVLAAFSNIRPSYIIPRKNSKEQKSKSQKEPKSETNNKENQSTPATKSQNRNSKPQTNSNSSSKKQNNNTSRNNKTTSSKRNSIDTSTKIESNDNGDYSTDDESITNNNKKKTKAKTPQKKSNSISTSKKVEGQKANTVRSQKQKTKQTPKSTEKGETPKRQRHHKGKKNSEAEDQSVTGIENTDIDSIKSVEQKEQTPKKMVRPKQATPRGGKYFPGFYDNLDFFVNKSPHKH